MKRKAIKLIFDFLAAAMFVGIVWIIIAQFYINPKKLKQEPVRYTIARVTDFFNLSDGPRSFNFIFTVKEKVFKGSQSAYKKNVKKGDRLLVRFLESDPGTFELVSYTPILDTTIQVSEYGWEKQPF